MKMNDTVNHPNHYISGDFEILDVIDAFELPMHLGNCAKYIFRAGRKSKKTKLEDLKKAQFHLNRYVDILEDKKGFKK